MSPEQALSPGTAQQKKLRCTIIVAGSPMTFYSQAQLLGCLRVHTFYGWADSDYNSSADSDYAIALAVDAGGNVYVAGQSGGTWYGPAGQDPIHAYSGGGDIFVLKLNSSGAYQWHTFYGSAILTVPVASPWMPAATSMSRRIIAMPHGTARRDKTHCTHLVAALIFSFSNSIATAATSGTPSMDRQIMKLPIASPWMPAATSMSLD